MVCLRLSLLLGLCCSLKHLGYSSASLQHTTAAIKAIAGFPSGGEVMIIRSCRFPQEDEIVNSYPITHKNLYSFSVLRLGGTWICVSSLSRHFPKNQMSFLRNTCRDRTKDIKWESHTNPYLWNLDRRPVLLALEVPGEVGWRPRPPRLALDLMASCGLQPFLDARNDHAGGLDCKEKVKSRLRGVAEDIWMCIQGLGILCFRGVTAI